MSVWISSAVSLPSFLNINLPFLSKARTSLLSSAIFQRHHGAARLPTLLERLLRSGTLLNPSVTADYFSYGGVTDKTVATLRQCLPFATMEVRG